MRSCILDTIFSIALTNVFFGLYHNLLYSDTFSILFSSFIFIAPTHDYGNASIFYFEESICFVAELNYIKSSSTSKDYLQQDSSKIIGQKTI